ncbi:MAG: hypothetical protein LBH25_09145 [Fibromonadaceae bacterium]|jgi:hypothetical protein|nr:hypothetical protein [Fibromonadaceae bacterium]
MCSTANDFENRAVNELIECVCSINEPLDLSDRGKFLEQDQPLQNYFSEPDSGLPLCVLYLDSKDLELVANDRFEISVATDFSVIYRIGSGESIKGGLEKGKKCLAQFVDNINKRQRSGTALIPFYLNGEAEIKADTPNGIDYGKIDPVTATATAKFILNSIKTED